MNEAEPQSRVVGVVPWLPWPLSAWRWWTAPVRGERLAALRIGLAACLLLDLLVTYLPGLLRYYGPDALGGPEHFGWLTGSPRLTWSLLRGFADPLTSFLALAGWALVTLWILFDLGTRLLRGEGPRERDALRFSLPIWTFAGTVYVLGVWARLAANGEELEFAWVAPLVLAAVAMFFLGTELLRFGRRGAEGPRAILALLAVNVVCAAVFLAGAHLSVQRQLESESIWSRVLSPWDKDAEALVIAMGIWIGVTVMLLLGLWTRPAAIATFMLSCSFANLNNQIDNAGDTIRGIILFYLMLCPCGAVWSVDRLWQRWRSTDAAVPYVSPWPIRLLFIQLAFIYFCNGVYKLAGDTWRDGTSLYYVLGDCTLTRFSLAQLPLPIWLIKVLTWSVVTWEVSFPVLVVNRWTRMVALLFGVGFHLGILCTMELGFFAPYALCLYLPLVPWERLPGLRGQRACATGPGSPDPVP
jgi:hypothetical protein